MYLPIPSHVWYRVENTCPNEINVDKELYKGNLLQYKKNSASFTKSQTYSQICNGFGPQRKKNWATQTETFSNPNNQSLKRVGQISIPLNDFQKKKNPNAYCPNQRQFQDGGNLLCNQHVNPCTQETVQTTKERNIYPTTDSDVPGKEKELYWNPKIQTWYPKTRRIMNTTSDKFPINYKLFTSALKPNPPILHISPISGNTYLLSWSIQQQICIPTTSFLLYKNQIPFQNFLYPTSTFVIDSSSVQNEYFIVSISNTYSSVPSNMVYS
jgi:hypothetical protein